MRRLAAGDPGLGREARDRHLRARARHLDDVARCSVPLTTTVSAEPSPPPPVAARSTSTLVDVRAGQVADGDRVGAAERADVDALDAVGVHRDRGDVAGQAHARCRWRRASICSPMLEPLKSSVSVPPWPSTMSLPSPGSHWKRSSPAPSRAWSAPMLPSTRSLPLPPSRRSAPSPPRERVVAVAAVERERGERGDAVLAGDRVVAGEAGDDQALDGRDRRAATLPARRPRPRLPLRAIPIWSSPAVPSKRAVSSPVAAVDVERDRAGDADRRSSTVSSPPSGRDDEVVERRPRRP